MWTTDLSTIFEFHYWLGCLWYASPDSLKLFRKVYLFRLLWLLKLWKLVSLTIYYVQVGVYSKLLSYTSWRLSTTQLNFNVSGMWFCLELGYTQLKGFVVLYTHYTLLRSDITMYCTRLSFIILTYVHVWIAIVLF